MGTRTVADTLRYLVDPWASQSVVFTLLSPIASVDGLYLPRSLTATTDITGAFSIALPVPDDPGEAGTYTCLLPNGQTIPFPLSAGVGSVRLGSLFVEAISTASPNDLQVLIDNHAAVEASTIVSGHVTVDGITITATDGVLSAAGGGGGAPTSATYVTLSTNATLTGERVLTAGSNITVTDNGAGGTVVVAAPAVATSAALTTEASTRASADSALDTRVDALELAPPAHAPTHSSGGSDPISHNNLAGLTSGDPHTQYQLESEKAQASGYASLGAAGTVPAAQLATGLIAGKELTSFPNGQGVWINRETLTLPEQASTPGTPAADNAILYAIDENGVTVLNYEDSTGFVARPLRDIFLVVRNTTGSTLTKGQAVYINGTFSGSGIIPTVALARANTITTLPAVGIVAADITNNSTGRVITEGRLDAINTSGSGAADGQRVFVSAATAGAFTATAPSLPNQTQRLGIVIRSHASQGSILVDPQGIFTDSGGSSATTFSIGDGVAGAKVLRFLAADAGDISWTPTAARTITLPDASGTPPLLGTANTFSATNTFSGTVNIGTGASLSYGATFDVDGLILRPNLALAGARIYCYTNGNSLLSPFVLVNENAGTSAGAGLVIAAGSTFIGGLVSQLIGSALNSRTVLRVLSNGNLTANDATGVFYIEGATAGPLSVLRAPLSVIPVSTTATTSAVPTLTLDANTSAGTPGTGFGASLLMLGRSSTTASQSMATWETTWATATHASRKARTVGTVFDTASREWIRGEASGTAAMVGFLGAAATARESVVANATDLASAIALVNDLKAKLITKGLIS